MRSLFSIFRFRREYNLWFYRKIVLISGANANKNIGSSIFGTDSYLKSVEEGRVIFMLPEAPRKTCQILQKFSQNLF